MAKKKYPKKIKTTKTIYLNIKDLSFNSEQNVDDLIRFLKEHLPQLDISRDGYELVVIMPAELSKRAIRTRIKNFLYKKSLKEKFRPIQYKTDEKDGYSIKERKVLEFSYY